MKNILACSDVIQFPSVKGQLIKEDMPTALHHHNPFTVGGGHSCTAVADPS